MSHRRFGAPLATTAAITALAAAALAATGCGDGGSSATAAKPAAEPASQNARTAQPASATARTTPTVAVHASAYGRVLFDGHGRALYLFTREHSSTPRCYGSCAAVWPPYVVRSTRVVAGAGTSGALIGTVRRSDGSLQATYAGHSLYYYVSDVRRGQITCQNVESFGGTWLVVDARGAAVR